MLKTLKKSIHSKTKKASQTYYIHDNHGRPFKVNITGNTVFIYKLQQNLSNSSNNNNVDKYTNKPILTYQVQNYFIGNSPKCKMTLFSGGYGPKFNGNTILLHINDNNYIYIGEKIYSFMSKSKIIKYISPVGNNDVPYPYAIDINNNVYLMIENVILGKYNSGKYDIPYYQYYSEYSLRKYKGIQDFKLCNQFSDFTYEPFPINEYERLMSLDWCEGISESKMEIKVNNKMKLLTKKMYVKLINEFGEHMKYSPLLTKIIVERL